MNNYYDWLKLALSNLSGFQTSADINYSEESRIQGWCPTPIMDILGCALFDYQGIYLEIGTFCGRSLAGALKCNSSNAIVIDPLNLWTGNGEVWDLWNKTIDDFKLRDRVTLYREYAENFTGELPPISVFFYDGNHDSGHTYEALKKYSQYLTQQAVIIVDDYNIYGGDQQNVFPGHDLDINTPVKTDTERWIAENKDKIKDVIYTPWLNGQVIIFYENIS